MSRVPALFNLHHIIKINDFLLFKLKPLEFKFLFNKPNFSLLENNSIPYSIFYYPSNSLPFPISQSNHILWKINLLKYVWSRYIKDNRIEIVYLFRYRDVTFIVPFPHLSEWIYIFKENSLVLKYFYP